MRSHDDVDAALAAAGSVSARLMSFSETALDNPHSYLE